MGRKKIFDALFIFWEAVRFIILFFLINFRFNPGLSISKSLLLAGFSSSQLLIPSIYFYYRYFKNESQRELRPVVLIMKMISVGCFFLILIFGSGAFESLFFRINQGIDPYESAFSNFEIIIFFFVFFFDLIFLIYLLSYKENPVSKIKEEATLPDYKETKVEEE